MAATKPGWNNAERVREPASIQRLRDRIDGEIESNDAQSLALEFQRLQILTDDVDKSAASIGILTERLKKYRRGTLEDRYTTNEGLRSMASARNITIQSGGVWTPTRRTQLIQQLQESDASAEPCRLLALPPELRSEIFKYAVLSGKHMDSCNAPVLPELPPLLFVNRQLRREAGEIFFSSTPIALPCYLEGLPDGPGGWYIKCWPSRMYAPAETIEWLKMAGSDLLPAMRSCVLANRVLDFEVPRYAAWPDIKTGIFNFTVEVNEKRITVESRAQIELSPVVHHGAFSIFNMRLGEAEKPKLPLDDGCKLRLAREEAQRLALSFQEWQEWKERDARSCWNTHTQVLLLNYVEKAT